MPSFIVFTIILGIGVCLMTFFLGRTYLTPRKVAPIAALVKDRRTKTAIRVSPLLLAKDSRNCDLRCLLGLSSPIAGSSFSRQEIDPAESRPIDLVGRETLQVLQSRANQ